MQSDQVRIDWMPSATLDVRREDGELVVERVVQIREGPMPYNRGIDALVDPPEDMQPGETRLQWEHVPREELTSDVARTTLAGAAVTDGHPPITAEQADQVDQYAEGMNGEQVYLVTVEDDIYGEVAALATAMVITDAGLAESIEEGRAQISTARLVDIHDEPGTFRGQDYEATQRNLRFWHSAVVDQGRCGPTCSIEETQDARVVGVGIDATDALNVNDRIVERDDEWCVVSEDGDREFGCFETREEAVQRLREVEHFSENNEDALPEDLDELQAVLDQSFGEFVTSRIQNMEKDREEVLESIAGLSNRTVEEVRAQVAGAIIPSDAVRSAIAQTLGVSRSRLEEMLPDQEGESTDTLDRIADMIAPDFAGRDNGGEPGEKSETTDRGGAAAVKVTVTIDGQEHEVDLSDVDCEECSDEIERAVYLLRCADAELEDLREERSDLQGRLDGIEDQLEQLQEQPGPEGPEEGGSEEDENFKIQLIMAIQEEQEDYSFTDEQGNVKSLQEVMKDALQILADVDVEAATDGLPEDMDEDTYLRARLDSVLDGVPSGDTPDEDGEEVEDPDEGTEDEEVQEVQDVEDLQKDTEEKRQKLDNPRAHVGS